MQAWPSAAESIHDPLLDEMRLSSVLIEACSPSSDKNQAVINDILDGVLSMRYKLNGVNKLATEDAKAQQHDQILTYYLSCRGGKFLATV